MDGFFWYLDSSVILIQILIKYYLTLLSDLDVKVMDLEISSFQTWCLC